MGIIKHTGVCQVAEYINEWGKRITGEIQKVRREVHGVFIMVHDKWVAMSEVLRVY